MKFRRVPFPKYLNRPRLWLLFEEDELKFIAIIDIIVGFILFMIGVPAYIFLFFLVVSTYLSLKVYREIRKKVSHNAIDFFFYELGLYNPKPKNRRNKKDVELPYGFHRRLLD